MTIQAPQPSEYESLDDYYDDLDAWECPECHGYGLDYVGPIRLRDGRVNHAKYACRHCGHPPSGCWLEKPRSKEQAKARRSRRGKHRLPAPIGEEKCFICHRTRTELALLNLHLEDAHDDAHSDLIDAGIPDDPAKHVWLCSEHHQWVEHERAHVERYRNLLHLRSEIEQLVP